MSAPGHKDVRTFRTYVRRYVRGYKLKRDNINHQMTARAASRSRRAIRLLSDAVLPDIRTYVRSERTYVLMSGGGHNSKFFTSLY